LERLRGCAETTPCGQKIWVIYGKRGRKREQGLREREIGDNENDKRGRNDRNTKLKGKKKQ